MLGQGIDGGEMGKGVYYLLDHGSCQPVDHAHPDFIRLDTGSVRNTVGLHPIHSPHGPSCEGLDIELEDSLESTDYVWGRKYLSVSFSQATGPQEPLASTLVRHDAAGLRLRAAIIVVIVAIPQQSLIGFLAPSKNGRKLVLDVLCPTQSSHLDHHSHSCQPQSATVSTDQGHRFRGQTGSSSHSHAIQQAMGHYSLSP